MTFSKKIKDMAVFIEFLAGSGLAILFHWGLDNREAAYIIFAIGILLSLATWLLREELGQTREELREQYLQAHEIPAALAQITDPECQAKGHELLAAAKRTLALLQQGFIPLDDTEFYLEGAKLSDHAGRTVKAVDPLSSGWGTRGALLNFYQANLRALERGVRITRIFVVGRDDISDPDTQKVLAAQYHDGIDVRIAFRDELPTASDISGRDTNSSCDFAIYDDQSVTDVFVQPGKYYGRKTAQQAEVDKYLRLYELIEHSAHTVTIDNGLVVPAIEALAAAS